MQFPVSRWGRRLAAAAVFLGVVAAARGEEPLPSVERLQSSPMLRGLEPNPMPRPARTPAERTVGQMYVRPGFRVELVAAEPQVEQPVAFAWDARGRLWVAEAYSYPQKRPEGQGLDRILIFEDRDGDGVFETRKVFAEHLNLVSGFEVGYGGVWIGAAPQLLFIPDRNHDDVPDGPPEVLLDGFGFQDTHECLNSFLWGPDGWLYGNQGVFNLAHIGRPGAKDSERTELRAGIWRYHPVRRRFEVFAEGGSNPWGLDYDERGQIFMSHCRSYWGRGCVTHVIQGGQFWNQANANYAPYIVPEPPADFPEFRNFLLASARHDHGAGGAGQRGTDAIFGGHSHVGTMIYQGDNWPAVYRGRLFTHNLGGHQINQEINLADGSGFKTVHADSDLLFCSDPRYVAVDLQYGPDGAVYMIDWADRQHCHNPDTERWDRSDGRIYRLEWAATYKPAKVDLENLGDTELAGMLTHPNAWYARMAQRILAERASLQPDRARRSPATPVLTAAVKSGANPAARLNALWSLHGLGADTLEVLTTAAADPDEYVRGWAVQLAAERGTGGRGARLLERLAQDRSPVVRRFVASAVQRVDEGLAWKLIGVLAGHGEDAGDWNLPLLLWDGIAPRMKGRLDQAFKLAAATKLPRLSEYIYWYAAVLDAGAMNRVLATLPGLEGEALRRRLSGLELAVQDRPGLAMPSAWKTVAPRLYGDADPRVQRQAERIAAVFGDASMFPRLRRVLAAQGDAEGRKHAFAVLSRALDRESLPVFLGLLDEPAFRSAVIPLLGRFESPEVAPALVGHFAALSPADRSTALSALTARASFALSLLDAVEKGVVKRDQLTAFHIRALTELKNPEVDRRVAATWGRILQSPAEKRAQMDTLEKVFDEAPLWAYSEDAGREHFRRLCSQCHKIGADGVRLGPELTGAGKQGIRYFLENVIDPNAVIGADFQMTVVETKKGEVLSGLLGAETPEALTLRTATGPVTVPKPEIATRATSDKSLMPEGLLETLGDRERLELLKFLTSN